MLASHKMIQKFYKIGLLEYFSKMTNAIYSAKPVILVGTERW